MQQKKTKYSLDNGSQYHGDTTNLELNVSTMVPLSAQSRKTLGEWHSQPIPQTTTRFNFENPPMFSRTPISLYFILMTRQLNAKKDNVIINNPCTNVITCKSFLI